MSYRVLNSKFSLHLMLENGGIIKQWNMNLHSQAQVCLLMFLREQGEGKLSWLPLSIP